MSKKDEKQEFDRNEVRRWWGIGAGIGAVFGLVMAEILPQYPYMSWVLLGACLGKGANWIWNFYKGFTE